MESGLPRRKPQARTRGRTWDRPRAYALVEALTDRRSQRSAQGVRRDRQDFSIFLIAGRVGA